MRLFLTCRSSGFFELQVDKHSLEISKSNNLADCLLVQCTHNLNRLKWHYVFMGFVYTYCSEQRNFGFRTKLVCVVTFRPKYNWVLRDRISQQNVWICWLPTSISVNLVQMILFACNFECYRVTWIVSWPFSICFLKGLVFVLFRQWHFFVQSDLQYLLVLRNWHQIGSRVLSLSPFFHPIHWLFAYIRCYLYELIKFKLVKCF